jgi:putative endonuclease
LLSERVHFVYMVRCADGTLYTGYARDPERRAKVHNTGRGAKYTSHRLPVSLVYAEPCESRSDALKREYALKSLSRSEKEVLVRAKAMTK